MQLKIALETIVVGILAAFALILAALYMDFLDADTFVNKIKTIIISSKQVQSPLAYTITILLLSIAFSFCYLLGLCINHIMFSIESKCIIPKLRRYILKQYYNNNDDDLKFIDDRYYHLFKTKLDIGKIDNVDKIDQIKDKDIRLFFGKIKIYMFQKIEKTESSYEILEERRRLLRGSIPSFRILSIIFFCEAVTNKLFPKLSNKIWQPTSVAFGLLALSVLMGLAISSHRNRSIKLQNETLLRNFLVYHRSEEASSKRESCSENTTSGSGLAF